ATVAGAPPGPTVITRMRELGARIVHVYGMTEAYGPYALNEWQTGWSALPPSDQARRQARQGVAMVQADPIRVGGENISTVEIEHSLEAHPAVLEVVVIGIPDEKWGERPKAFVIRKPGAEVNEAELIGYLQTHLARFKVPKSVEFIDELPRTATGKPQKFELREKEWAGHSSRIQG